MSLRNRRFERHVRKIARARLMQSRSSWKEYKGSRSRVLRPDSLIHRAFFPVILAWAFIVASENGREYAAFGLAVYGIGSILTRRQHWSSVLDGLDRNYFYLHHPLPDRTIFSEHMKAMFKATAWSVIVFAVGLRFLFRSPTPWALIVALAVAMGVASFAGVVILVRFFPRLPGITALAVYLCYGFVLLGFPLLEGWTQPIQHALMLTPVGSIVFFVSQYRLHGNLEPLALIPAAAAVVLLPVLYRQIAGSYSTAPLVEELSLTQGSDEDADTEPQESMPVVLAERRIRDRWDTETQGARLWLDEFIHRQFTIRESVVCRLLCGSDKTYWTQWWIRGIKLAMIPVALMFVTGYVPQWLVLFPAIIAMMCGIPLLGGAWAGFSDVWSSGKLAPFYATFPVTFSDIAGVILKANIIRVLAWTPGFLMVFVSSGRAFEIDFITGVVHGLQFLFIAICLQPFTVIAKFSKGSNDSSAWGPSAVLVIVSVFALGLACLGLAVALFFVGGYLKLVFAVSMAVTSLVSLRVYRLGYDSCYWDLLRDVR